MSRLSGEYRIKKTKYKEFIMRRMMIEKTIEEIQKNIHTMYEQIVASMLLDEGYEWDGFDSEGWFEHLLKTFPLKELDYSTVMRNVRDVIQSIIDEIDSKEVQL